MIELKTTYNAIEAVMIYFLQEKGIIAKDLPMTDQSVL